MTLKLRVRDVARTRGWNLSQLQRRADLGMTTARRLWFGTGDGREQGPPLQFVSLEALDRIARVLDVDPRDLIARDE
jgi:DNA-binding Xre family transcriptional regulator